MKIGFIGLGIMGGAMGANPLKGGHAVPVRAPPTQHVHPPLFARAPRQERRGVGLGRVCTAVGNACGLPTGVIGIWVDWAWHGCHATPPMARAMAANEWMD